MILNVAAGIRPVRPTLRLWRPAAGWRPQGRPSPGVRAPWPTSARPWPPAARHARLRRFGSRPPRHGPWTALRRGGDG